MQARRAEFAVHQRLQRNACGAFSANPIDDALDQIETVKSVQHGHIERRRSDPLLIIAAHMQMAMIGSSISSVGQAMNRPRKTVVGKDDGCVSREKRIVFRP